MQFHELSRDGKIQALVQSMSYLVAEGFDFAKPLANLTYRELETVASHLLDNKDNLPQETREQILDEAVQYGKEFGY